jgi:hypothetical protein
MAPAPFQVRPLLLDLGLPNLPRQSQAFLDHYRRDPAQRLFGDED